MFENTLDTAQDTQANDTDYEAFYAEFDDDETDTAVTAEDNAANTAAGTAVDTAADEAAPAEKKIEEPDQKTKTEENTAETEMFPREIKVYGQVQKISMDDAVKAIQLSYAMPKMQEKLTAANAQLEELAKLKGCGSVAEFIEKTKLDTEFGKLVEKYGSYENIPDEVIKVHTENSKLRNSQAQAQAAKEQRDKAAAEYENFMSAHPEVDKIPNEVVAMVAEGRSNLEGAFSIFTAEKLIEENKSLKQAIEIEKKNNINKQTSTPSAKGSGGKKTETDIFDIFDD